VARKIEDREVRWGVIGAGDVCEVKSAPAMNIVDDSRLVAVMRRNAELAEDYARRHNVPTWYSDATDLISDPDVNAIYIATPPNAHRDLTVAAAAARKPVYVEKPMARTHAECLAMIAACNEANVPLYVAYYRRTLPHFLRVRELLAAGEIGDVRHVQVTLNQEPEPNVVSNLDNNWRVDPGVAGGGYFYDLASHQFDLLDFLLGPIASANGLAANQAGLYAAEDIVTATWQFESGVLGTGSWCYATSAASRQDLTTIVGSKGQISFETFGKGEFRLQTEDRDERFEFELPRHIQEFLIRDIVDDLLGRGTSPSTGESGARTNRIMEAICASQRT
jgi:predicted dehydrogenase